MATAAHPQPARRSRPRALRGLAAALTAVACTFCLAIGLSSPAGAQVPPPAAPAVGQNLTVVVPPRPAGSPPVPAAPAAPAAGSSGAALRIPGRLPATGGGSPLGLVLAALLSVLLGLLAVRASRRLAARASPSAR